MKRITVPAAALATLGAWPPPGRRAQQPPPGDLGTWHVQGNVHMIVGAGANIAVQIGEDGVLVVDTGASAMTDKVLAAIQKLSNRPIRWIVNTNGDPDHTGGNEKCPAAAVRSTATRRRSTPIRTSSTGWTRRGSRKASGR